MIGIDAVTMNLEMPCHHLQGSTKSKGELSQCMARRHILGSGHIDLLILNHSTGWR